MTINVDMLNFYIKVNFKVAKIAERTKTSIETGIWGVYLVL